MSDRARSILLPRWTPARPAVAGASMLLLLAGVTIDARGQGSTLDAPMHPIGKSEVAPSRCAKCPAADANDLEAQRVADRSAPEYQGGRRPVPESDLDPGENASPGLSGGQLSIAVPLR